MENRKRCVGTITIYSILFIVLKLIGAIDWPWLWVLAPLWIPYAVIVIALISAAVYSKVLENRGNQKGGE